MVLDGVPDPTLPWYVRPMVLDGVPDPTLSWCVRPMVLYTVFRIRHYPDVSDQWSSTVRRCSESDTTLMCPTNGPRPCDGVPDPTLPWCVRPIVLYGVPDQTLPWCVRPIVFDSATVFRIRHYPGVSDQWSSTVRRCSGPDTALMCPTNGPLRCFGSDTTLMCPTNSPLRCSGSDTTLMCPTNGPRQCDGVPDPTLPWCVRPIVLDSATVFRTRHCPDVSDQWSSTVRRCSGSDITLMCPTNSPRRCSGSDTTLMCPTNGPRQCDGVPDPTLPWCVRAMVLDSVLDPTLPWCVRPIVLAGVPDPTLPWCVRAMVLDSVLDPTLLWCVRPMVLDSATVFRIRHYPDVSDQ